MSSADEAAVVLEKVAFSYPDSSLAMRDVSLTVARGEMVAVIGPNGAGKSTLLRLMSGFLPPKRGRSICCGVDSRTVRRQDFARKVAFVAAQTALGFPYSVLEVVLMGRAPHVAGFRLESEADLEAATAAMRATGTTELAGRQFDHLSSGERQRVCIARALAQEPELLLLDEPGAFLDIRQTTAVYGILRRLNRGRRTTVVAVLHDLNLVSLYFDRVVMLKGGAVRAIGRPSDVLNYANVREVFETDVYVDLNTVTGTLNILPLPEPSDESG
jgi:iron complex transport system ATP-binding protein